MLMMMLMLMPAMEPAPAQKFPDYFVQIIHKRSMFANDEPVYIQIRLGNQKDRSLRARKWPKLLAGLTIKRDGKALSLKDAKARLYPKNDFLDMNAHRDFRVDLRRYFSGMEPGVYEVSYEDQFNEIKPHRISILNIPSPPKDKDFLLQTSKGDIVIRLDYQNAPNHATNFGLLTAIQFYKNLTWHRVMPGFVIQTGDPVGDGTGGNGFMLDLELSPFLKHNKYAVGMARGPARASANSQFYITAGATPELDNSYTVFGRVIRGFDVVDAISAVQTNGPNGSPPNKPLEPVVLVEVRAVDAE